MADIKNETVNPNGAEGNPNPNPDQKNDQADVKQPGKIKKFFEKHGGGQSRPVRCRRSSRWHRSRQAGPEAGFQEERRRSARRRCS